MYKIKFHHYTFGKFEVPISLIPSSLLYSFRKILFETRYNPKNVKFVYTVKCVENFQKIKESYMENDVL